MVIFSPLTNGAKQSEKHFPLMKEGDVRLAEPKDNKTGVCVLAAWFWLASVPFTLQSGNRRQQFSYLI